MTLTKKQCPHCGSTELVGLTSQNIKICNGCKKTHAWELSEGQKPLFERTAPDAESTSHSKI
jgi:ribosomal protein L37AE/L43A